MRVRSWFLPEEPDVVGYLRAQIAITLEGIDAFERWAEGNDGKAVEEINALEPRGDAKKRELMEELRAAFVVPLEPEDIFTLSRGIDWVLDGIVDLVAEAGVLARGPDQGIAEIAGWMREAMQRLDAAIAALGDDDDAATGAWPRSSTRRSGARGSPTASCIAAARRSAA
jgi:uncharacterized protein Yka (UPF0111/DUF47 family)